MNQTFQICKIDDIKPVLVDLMSTTFRLDPKLLDNQFDKTLNNYFREFKDNLWAGIEVPYVDRVYRDSYYMYFSSKYGRYCRDCIRVSIFEDKVDLDDFYSETGTNLIADKYLGFLVIRPTEPHFLGRNVVSPLAFNLPAFMYCSTEFNSTVNCLKNKVRGFPHSSQDGETYTCAETTIWALMEYFGTKYAEYRPTKPSQIHSILKSVAYERQLPSRGLTISQISFALKDFGFGCRIYSFDEYKEDFYRLLGCYISSGIPLAVGMDDYDSVNSNKIGHALLIVGYEKIKYNIIADLDPNKLLSTTQEVSLKSRNIRLYDLDDYDHRFVFIDDNFPPYQTATARDPVAHYDSLWSSVKIKNFVVPLYPKIYLEAYEAKGFIKEFIASDLFPLKSAQDVVLHFYLSSSRSCKHNVAVGAMNRELKMLILEKPMPRFVWIAELAELSQFEVGLRDGIVILDATEPDVSDNKPLILAAYNDKVIFFDGNNDILTQLSLSLSSFKPLNSNLQYSDR